MKTTKIGFLQEQLPNGVISKSSNRLMCMMALVSALTLIFALTFFDFYSWSNLIELVRDKTLTASDMKLLLGGTNMIIVGIIFTLLTYAFGFKAYSKGQELKSIDANTPTITDRPQ